MISGSKTAGTRASGVRKLRIRFRSDKNFDWQVSYIFSRSRLKCESIVDGKGIISPAERDWESHPPGCTAALPAGAPCRRAKSPGRRRSSSTNPSSSLCLGSTRMRTSAAMEKPVRSREDSALRSWASLLLPPSHSSVSSVLCRVV